MQVPTGAMVQVLMGAMVQVLMGAVVQVLMGAVVQVLMGAVVQVLMGATVLLCIWPRTQEKPGKVQEFCEGAPYLASPQSKVGQLISNNEHSRPQHLMPCTDLWSVMTAASLLRLESSTNFP